MLFHAWFNTLALVFLGGVVVAFILNMRNDLRRLAKSVAKAKQLLEQSRKVLAAVEALGGYADLPGPARCPLVQLALISAVSTELRTLRDMGPLPKFPSRAWLCYLQSHRRIKHLNKMLGDLERAKASEVKDGQIKDGLLELGLDQGGWLLPSGCGVWAFATIEKDLVDLTDLLCRFDAKPGVGPLRQYWNLVFG